VRSHAHPPAHHAAAHRAPAPAVPEPQPTAAAERAAPLPRFDRPTVSHHLAEELHLMHAASAALTADDPDHALRILADHAKRFPDGALARERHALRTIGLCKQHAPEARRERDAFLRSSDLSPLAARVREACEGVK
jgi:hypothetical protein